MSSRGWGHSRRYHAVQMRRKRAVEMAAFFLKARQITRTKRSMVEPDPPKPRLKMKSKKRKLLSTEVPIVVAPKRPKTTNFKLIDTPPVVEDFPEERDTVFELIPEPPSPKAVEPSVLLFELIPEPKALSPPKKVAPKNAVESRQELLTRLLEFVDEQQAEQIAPFEARVAKAEIEISGSLGRPSIHLKRSEAALNEARRAHATVIGKMQVIRHKVKHAATHIKSERDCRIALRKLVPDAPEELLGLSSEAKVRHSMFEFDRCVHCDSSLTMDVAEQVLLCPACGSRTDCPDPGGMALSITYFNLDRRASLLMHKRLPKLKEMLKQLLAKQKSVVPPAVLMDVATELHRMRRKSRSQEIEFRHTRQALINLGMRSFLDYATQIHCRITNTKPPQLTHEQEEALCVLFVCIQRPFEELKERSCSTFFSITYVVLTLCRFLRFDHLLPYICLGNTRTRIETQQELMRKVFKKLGWKPFPVLTSEQIRNKT